MSIARLVCYKMARIALNTQALRSSARAALPTVVEGWAALFGVLEAVGELAPLLVLDPPMLPDAVVLADAEAYSDGVVTTK